MGPLFYFISLCFKQDPTGSIAIIIHHAGIILYLKGWVGHEINGDS
jgi:hypothetical protein